LDGALPAPGTFLSAALFVAATACLAAALLRWCERRLIFHL
jgi:hypothetical protein